MATIFLVDPETGEPLVIMDGRLITEMRTAAVSAAATSCSRRQMQKSSLLSAAACRRTVTSRLCAWSGIFVRFRFGVAHPSTLDSSLKNSAPK
jgi:hypothetical protein